MRQNTYRGNLTSAEFPLLSDLQGRNVIVTGLDQNYSRQLASNKNKDRDIGIPQIYYMHNVVPTDAGVCSISYSELVKAPLDTDTTFSDIFYLQDSSGAVGYIGITSSGRNYVLEDINIGWIRTTDKAALAKQFISTATVNGQTYIYYGGVGCFKYSFTTKALVPVTLTALDPVATMGICNSSGYMIAWTNNTVKWSSTIDPTDFTPSLATGAGGQGIQEAKADIMCCLPQSGGFIVYTKKNAVGAAYTGNAQYPFNFKETTGAGGLAKPSNCGADGNNTTHIAYTNAGIQEISIRDSSIIYPQVTDFLAGSQFEDFDEKSMTFTVSQITGALVKKITIISNRYIIISYGQISLTHALLYDLGLARWGKLKNTHVDCFEYTYPSPDTVDAPRKSIGFLSVDGTIRVATLSYDTTGSAGVVICGKYQMDRNRYINLQTLSLESIKTNSSLNVKVMTTIDGKNNVSITTPYLAINQGTYREYACRASGMNHSIMISGAFHMNSLELKFTDAGAIR